MKENANKNPINAYITDSEDIKLLENSELRESVLSKYLIKYIKELNVQAVKAFLDEGANPNILTSDRTTPLMYAIKNTNNQNKDKIIDLLLSQDNPIKTEVDISDFSHDPLTSAFIDNDKDLFNKLMKAGADPYKPRTLTVNKKNTEGVSIYEQSQYESSNKQNAIDKVYMDENSARGKILNEIYKGKEWKKVKSNALDKLTQPEKITGVKSIIESDSLSLNFRVDKNIISNIEYITLDERIKLFNLLGDKEKVSVVKKLNPISNKDFYKYAMHDAVKLGNVELIKAISEKSDVNNMIVGGINPLTSAVKKGDINAIKALVNSGADINWKNENGSTAVSIANNDPSKLIALYSKNPEVLIQKKTEEAEKSKDYSYIRKNLLPRLDETQRINAIVDVVNNTRNPNLLKELTTNLSKEERNKINSMRETPAKNIRRDGVNNVDEFLNKNSLNPFERIIPADLIKHHDMFKKYESYDKSYTDGDKLYSAFDVAIMTGDKKKIDEYLKSIDKLSIVGKEPSPNYRENLSHHLLLSILSNNKDAVDALIKAGAYTDHFYYSNANDTPLEVAIKEGHPDIIKTLIKAGAKVQEYHIKLAKEIDNNHGDMKTTAALYTPSEIILNTVNKAKGFFYDSEKGWKDVNKLVESLNTDQVVDGVIDIFKNNKLSNDRKSKLFYLLDEDSKNRIIERVNKGVSASSTEKDPVTKAILNIADNDPKLLAKIYADKPEELLTNKMKEIEKKYIQDSKSFMSTFFKPVKNYEVVKGILEALGDKAKPAVSKAGLKEKEKLSELLGHITQDVKPTNKIGNNSHINDVLNKTQSTVNTLSTSSTITNETDTLTNKPNNTTKKKVTFAPEVLENAQKPSVEETKKDNSRGSNQIIG